MILECGHCGAPLDVRDERVAYRCRYCGHSSRIENTRMLMPQTPPAWRPPSTWRPPAHVPADSNTELRYQGGGGSSVLGTIVLVAIVATVGGAIAAGVSAARKGGSPFGVDPAKLDSITFTEARSAMQTKVGGGTMNDAKWLNVQLGGLFDYAVFQWDEKDLSHPAGVSIHASNRKSCTPELEAARTRLRERLGPRFDGKSWRWGAAYLNFDEKCSMVGFHVTFGSADDDMGDWKHQTEALWKLVRADVLGRPDTLGDDELIDFLGKGYDAAKVGKAVSKSTIDDAPSLRKKFPALTLRKLIGLDGELPLDHPRFASVRLSWNNEKGGGLRSLDLSGYGNELPDHLEVARCITKKMGVTLEVRETDYMKKKSDASFRTPKVFGNVGQYGAHISASGFGTIPSDAIESFMTAAATCK